mmetsp:Transcript_10983/g.33690  ORF Transcript_10983/g.33690 Transcript_10983/m.33690 type:complete len:390 (+) Transcript_10983:210-1379(+)
MSSLVGCLSAWQRAWLCGDGSTKLPSNAEDGQCWVVASELQAQDSGPELWLFHHPILLWNRGDGSQGSGWQIRVETPAGADGVVRSSASAFQFVVTNMNGRRTHLFARKTDAEGYELVQLAQVTDDVFEVVLISFDAAGNQRGETVVADMVRSCQYCFARGALCECPAALKQRHIGKRAEEGPQAGPSQSQSRTSQNVEPWADGSWGVLRRGSMFGSIQLLRMQSYSDTAAISRCTAIVQNMLSSSSETAQEGAGTGGSSGNAPSDVGSGVHMCPECDKSFTRAYYLRRHIDSVHKGIKPFKCEICGKSFSQKGHLNEHVRGRHSTDTLRCGVCSHTFGSKSKLSRHVRAVHENIRMHVCELCNKAFKEKSHLDKHYRSHDKKAARISQ